MEEVKNEETIKEEDKLKLDEITKETEEELFNGKEAGEDE